MVRFIILYRPGSNEDKAVDGEDAR